MDDIPYDKQKSSDTEYGITTSASNPPLFLIDELSKNCEVCRSPLCLRKQLINLALGNTEELLCLVCLAKQQAKPEAELLLAMKSYIIQRDCFHKEWIKYEDESFCPCPHSCFIHECFS